MNRQIVLKTDFLMAIRIPDEFVIQGQQRLTVMALSGMKLEPLVDLASGNIYGYEILSLLSKGKSSDLFFSDLSATAMAELFQLQLYLSRCMAPYPYFLNMPVRVLMNEKLCQYLARLGLESIRIEIQDTELLADLSLLQRKVLRNNLYQLLQAGAEIWADDVNPEQIPILEKMLLPLSGIKLSHYDFQRYSHDIMELRLILRDMKRLAPRVVTEGVETLEQNQMATLAGVTYGQGYLWPAKVYMFH